ncbi:MAG: VCBS repeat-containing protein [Oscillospiraceae bacterium]|nr:VCBS repeat-containing protein [Oscillospiraceae bacterium]
MSKRRLAMFFLLCGVLFALTGCANAPSFTLNPQELYALPKLPAKYTELNSLLTELLNGGAEYAAPTSGSNIQSVQLIDLNGDGREEAVAFFRNPTDEKPLKIFIFSAEEDTYRLASKIEGSGTAIYSINYVDMNADGKMEIAVGWKAAAELQVLEIYATDEDGTRPLVRTDYVKYLTFDLNGDSQQELLVLRAGEDGDGVADYYSWQEDGSLANRSYIRISSSMAELSQQGRVRSGTLRNGEPAVYVSGVTDQSMAVTDILTLRGGELANIVIDQTTGVSGEISPFCGLYPSDFNGDDLTETPRAIPLPTSPNGDPVYRLIEWRQFDKSGESVDVLRTYHNTDDGWYLRVPSAWKNRFYAFRAVSQGEASVTFCLRETSQPFLRISALTGSGRDMRAVRGGRVIIGRRTETIYTAELPDNNSDWEFSMTDEELRSAFSLIVREDWLTSDN